MIVLTHFATQSNFRPFAIGHKQGLAKGASQGAAVGLGMTGIYAAGGALQAIVAPYLAVIAVPVFSTAGALAGSQSVISKDEAATFEKIIQQNLASLHLSTTLAKTIEYTAQEDVGRQLPVVDTGPTDQNTTPDDRRLVKQDTDSIIEIGVPEVGFAGDKHLYFYLVAHVRVLRVNDGAQLYTREFVYQSDAYIAKLWAENQATLFKAELKRSFQSLAESVVEQLYLLTPLPLESRAKSTSLMGKQFPGNRDACGLAWVSPPRDFNFSLKLSEMQHPNFNRYPQVFSQPIVLAWEGFPRNIDNSGKNATILAGISHVRYDLRVWQVQSDAPPKLIYERRDLTTPSHTLERTLQAGAQYFWSVRARFEFNGQTRATKWGYFRTPAYLVHGSDKIKAQFSSGSVIGVFTSGVAPRDPCTLDFIPIANYYRFEIRH